MTAQIAVGDDPDEPTVRGHADAAQPLLGHLEDRVGETGVGPDQGQILAFVHQLLDPQQLAAELAARMEDGEVARGEAAPIQQRHRQRVAQGQHAGGGGRGREAHRAGLADLRQQQKEVGRLDQRARRPTDDGDQRNREPTGVENQVAQLGGLAGVGQGQHRVLRRDHAEVAVAGLGRMDVERRSAGRGQRGGDLARDVAALAHPGHHDASGHAGQQADHGRERRADPIGQAGQRLRLGDHHAAAAGDRRLGRGSGPWRGLANYKLADTFPPGAAGRWRTAGPAAPNIPSCAGVVNETGACVAHARHRGQWAKTSWSGQPARSSATRVGRKSKQACANSRRPSRSSMVSSRWRSACR